MLNTALVSARNRVLVWLMMCLCGLTPTLVSAAETIFQDSFTRPDSQTLGNPTIGGAWIETNELFTTIASSPNRGGFPVYPADIILKNGALTFHYADPQQGYPIGHAQPVAYAALSRAVQSSTLSFDFTPAPDATRNGGRVSHEVGLMTAANGFAIASCCTSQDYVWNIPKKGLGIDIGRSSYAYTNSTISLLKFDGIYPTNLGAITLPFQFDLGVTYHFVMSIANDTLSVSVSNGVQTANATAPLNGFTFLADQLFVLDDQAGNNGLKFDNFLVTTTTTPSLPPVPVSVVPLDKSAAVTFSPAPGSSTPTKYRVVVTNGAQQTVSVRPADELGNLSVVLNDLTNGFLYGLSAFATDISGVESPPSTPVTVRPHAEPLDVQEAGTTSPPLVFLHGFMSDAPTWNSTIANLPANYKNKTYAYTCLSQPLLMFAKRWASYINS